MRVNGPQPPIVYPTITIGGETLLVKFSILSQFKMSQAGLDPGEMLTALSPGSKDPKRHSYVFEMFAACVAENYVDRGEAPPTAEQWTLRLTKLAEAGTLEDLLVQIGKSVIDAILKQPPTSKSVQGTPAPELLDQKPS